MCKTDCALTSQASIVVQTINTFVALLVAIREFFKKISKHRQSIHVHSCKEKIKRKPMQKK